MSEVVEKLQTMDTEISRTTIQVSEEVYEKGVSLWADAWRKLKRNKLAMCGLLYLVGMGLVSIFAPMLAPASFEDTDLMLGAVAPDHLHWFGTDDLGRDVFTRVLFGARVSLTVGIVSTVVSVVIGVLYGAISGYVGGRTDNVMMRAVEILYALPFTVLVIVIMVVAGPSIYNLFIALGAVQWLVMARIVRGQVVSIKKMDYVEAARATGVSDLAIIMRHVIPNTLGPVIVFSSLTVPAVILEEAFLSFLGLWVQPPMARCMSAMEAYPWMVIFPCLSLVMTLLALNFFGDGLRDALDPRASKD
jgi:oligopeptide transport system permease protein